MIYGNCNTNFKNSFGGGVDKFDVPEYSKENLGICREALVEAVAETSEEFMDSETGNGGTSAQTGPTRAKKGRTGAGRSQPVITGLILGSSWAKRT